MSIQAYVDYALSEYAKYQAATAAELERLKAQERQNNRFYSRLVQKQLDILELLIILEAAKKGELLDFKRDPEWEQELNALAAGLDEVDRNMEQYQYTEDTAMQEWMTKTRLYNSYQRKYIANARRLLALVRGRS